MAIILCRLQLCVDVANYELNSLWLSRLERRLRACVVLNVTGSRLCLLFTFHQYHRTCALLLVCSILFISPQKVLFSQRDAHSKKREANLIFVKVKSVIAIFLFAHEVITFFKAIILYCWVFIYYT